MLVPGNVALFSCDAFEDVGLEGAFEMSRMLCNWVEGDVREKEISTNKEN